VGGNLLSGLTESTPEDGKAPGNSNIRGKFNIPLSEE